MELRWSALGSVYSFCMSDFPSKTECSLYWWQSTFNCHSLKNAQAPFTAQRRRKGIPPSPCIIKMCTAVDSGVDLCVSVLGFLLFGILEKGFLFVLFQGGCWDVGFLKGFEIFLGFNRVNTKFCICQWHKWLHYLVLQSNA